MDEATLERCGQYIESLYAPETEAMRWIRKELEVRDLPLIQVSALQGRLMAVLASIAGARRLLEIGTLGGYSGLWLLSLLPEDAHLVTLEVEAVHADLAREAFARAGEERRAEVRLGDARETLRDLSGRASFDLVFIDADKESYLFYLEQASSLLGPGGLLLADNTLRRGKVAEVPEDGAASVSDEEPDAETRALRRFNRELADDPRFETILVPIRDGLTVARRSG
ncbi:MAG TPA: O-methyltransferase [Gemmatimonadota bacterium]|nr:O-methyltransferase [Gemmatimonadota bacterium]